MYDEDACALMNTVLLRTHTHILYVLTGLQDQEGAVNRHPVGVKPI